MPGYIQGVIEKQMGIGKWEFLSRIEPFTGSQGNFKYMAFGMKRFRFLEPFPHDRGFPEDLSLQSKAVISLNEYRQHLDEPIAEFECGLKKRRTVLLSDIKDIDWDKGISDENLQRLREEYDSKEEYHEGDYRNLEVFELTDSEGNSLSEKNLSWYRKEDITDEMISSLVAGDTIDFRNRKVSLERKSRRELLPESWFKLLDLLDIFHEDHEIRFVFGWHH